ncbi:MAG: Sir2 family protein [Campylobacterota bacterium]|nr:Sir2 family protein [Campylobacterota bacterium]
MHNIKEAKQIIQDADAILITTGAGMGVDSGLPDFRGNEGFWRAYPPIAKLGLSFSQMANPSWFGTNPELSWAFYGHRLHLYRNTVPHKGFEMLLELVKVKENNYFIFTSNVDGQFQKAGFDEENIYEVHGSIHYMQCTKNCTNKIWSANETKVEVDMESFAAHSIPACSYCQEVARPNILMFNDWFWNKRRAMRQEEKYRKWLKKFTIFHEKLAIIEIGAGSAIPTVRRESENLAKRYPNIQLIRINTTEAELNGAKGCSIEKGGSEGLRVLLDEPTYK